jgi:TonB family protein
MRFHILALFTLTATSILSAQTAPPATAGLPKEPAAIMAAAAPLYDFNNAKAAHIDGTVVLQATIGMDGGVHNLHVVSAPSPSLAASALWAVSHWEYRPYFLNGEPVEVQTTINVIFSLR